MTLPMGPWKHSPWQPEALQTFPIQVSYAYQLSLRVEIAAFSFVIPFGNYVNRPSNLLVL